jgi:hypothetical protein
MSIVEFGTPPKQRTRHLVQEQAQALRAAPGDWAIIRKYPKTKAGQRAAHNYASHIRKGRMPSMIGFEAEAHTVEDRVEVWARCVDGSSSY